jgi:lactoylglutathione lyase
MRLSYAIVFVSDMKSAVAFYCDVVGLPLRFESPGWTEFATEGATLALHVQSGDEPAGRCRPGLNVPNLDEFHRKMIEHQVTCVAPPKETFGTRIAQYLDRDGLEFSVAEERTASQ